MKNSYMLNKVRHHLLFFTVLGSCLEFYDFAIYSLFAVFISQAFFPQHHSLVSLLNTFGIMAIGYLARPLGSLVFGHFGDKFGRKNTFSTTILLMSLSTLFTGLIPSYHHIGIFAPLLLLICRFIQGLSVGGETAGSAIFLAEHTAEKHRGLIVAIIFAGFTSGFILSSLTAMVIHHYFSSQQITQFAWRIPFLFGCLLGIVSYFVRKQVKESPIFNALVVHKQQNFPAITLLKTMPWRLVQGVCLTAMVSESVVVFLFIPAYFVYARQITHTSQTHFTLLAGVLLSCLSIVFGGVADYVGRKRVLMISSVIMILVGFPLFSHLDRINDHNIWLFAVIYVLLIAPANGTYGLKLIEIFPAHLRYSGMALSYNLSFAIFGGTAPLVNSYLTHNHGYLVAYGFIAFTALCTLISAFFLKKDASNIYY